MKLGSNRVARWTRIGCTIGVLVLTACEQAPDDEPHGGGYTAAPAPEPVSDSSATPKANSTLGKAKQAAERVINEDVAEYNKKLEAAADDVFKKR